MGGRRQKNICFVTQVSPSPIRPNGGLLACGPKLKTYKKMARTRGKHTEDAIRIHIKALGQRLEDVVSGYSQDAILLTPDHSYQGTSEIRDYYQAFMRDTLPLLAASYTIERFDVIGEAGYLTWSALPSIPLGTDTILVHEGKIVLHTRTIHMLP